MWKIISLLLPWFIATIVISQVILPLLLKKDMFWLFKKKNKTDTVHETVTLEDEINSAKEDVSKTEERISGVKNKANKNYEAAEKLKRKADSI